MEGIAKKMNRGKIAQENKDCTTSQQSIKIT